MYLSDKPQSIDFYKEVAVNSDLMISHIHHNQNQKQNQDKMGLGESSGGEDHEMKAPKKRAETWIQDETRALISYRSEADSLFNTSKSNKHLWELISAKMRENGFDRSPTMCTDKWRNLLKEFKKAKDHHDRGGTGLVMKMCYYKELDELLKDRSKFVTSHSRSMKSDSASITPYIQQFSNKDVEGAGMPFGPVEGGAQPTANLEMRLDQEGDALAITAADDVVASGIPPWWREAPGNGTEGNASYGGRVISVKWGEYTRRIGIDGTAGAIKEAIRSSFRLRTKRAFWLEDEDQVVRTLDRDMPLGNYILHLDEGITIKVCLYDDSERLTVRTEERTIYTEDDFKDFLTRRGLAGLRELNGFRSIDTLDDLHSGEMYQGVRLLGD